MKSFSGFIALFWSAISLANDSIKRRLLRLCAHGLWLGLLCLLVWINPPLLQQWRMQGFDTLQHISPREYTSSPVIIVDIDEASLSAQGQWPWPRTLLAELVERIAGAGASAIALDIILAEPDRLSADGSNDAALANVLASTPSVTGFAFNDHPARPPAIAGAGVAALAEITYIPAFASAVSSLPVLEDAAQGNAALNAIPDADGVIRRVPLYIRHTGNSQIYPALSVEALRVGAQASAHLLFADVYGMAESTTIGDYTIPLESDASFWLHDTGHVPARYVSAASILAEEVEASTLQGAIVLIGSSASGLKDIRATVLDSAMSGVELHAQALEQMLLGHFLTRPAEMLGVELLLTLFGAVCVILSMRSAHVWVSFICMLCVVGVPAYAAWMMFTQYHVLMDGFTPALAGLLSYILYAAIRHYLAERERGAVRDAFSRYLAPDLVEQLARNPRALELGGQMRDMTIMFMDIRGFTTIAESMDAARLTELINACFTPMSDIIMRHGGTVDKYIGDCIMAFWNAPLDQPDHAARAAAATLAMQAAIPQLQALDARLNIGIGINSGACCVGNMGSRQRFDYSVLGDAVNLAARLEGQSKDYGYTIIAGDSTRKGAPDMAWLLLDTIIVKGKTVAVPIYALCGDAHIAQSADFLAAKTWLDTLHLLYSQNNQQAIGAHMAHVPKHIISPQLLERLAEKHKAEKHKKVV